MKSGAFNAGRRVFSSVLFAGFFIFVGIIIASMLDLPATPIIAKDHPDVSPPAQLSDRPEDFSTPFIKVVATARDAVVNITAESENNYRGTPMDEYFRFFGLNHPRTYRSYGTGFMFRKEGYILTNNHVIEGADKINITLSGTESYAAKLVGTDPATDLAVLKIEATGDLPVISFGHSKNLQIGEWVVAIGNPFPQQGLDRTVTAGVVSATGRKNLHFADGSVTYQNYIQTDASINPGNSGGPLLNLKGEAVGVNAAISSPTGSSVGIGFAIPIDFARAVVPDLISHGKVIRGWLGLAEVTDVPREVAREMNLSVPAVTFRKVMRNSPAAAAGLRPGDLIVKYNGKAISDADDFRFQVATTPINSTIELGLLRNGQETSLAVTIGDLAKSNQAMDSPGQAPYDDNYWYGMAVAECTPDMAYQFGVDCQSTGVMVVEVVPTSPAYRANLVPGVTIVEIDKYEIRDLNDYRNAVAGLKNRKNSIPLIIIDTEGNTGMAAIRPGR